MNINEPDLILYGRQDCHLCDEAEQLLQQLASPPHYAKVDIDGQLALLRAYGPRIPVLRARASSAELQWPFDAAGLQRWLAQWQPHSA
ncbi:MAG: glutaredoxin family protein [Wenzhouxiangellaceae bacterium]